MGQYIGKSGSNNILHLTKGTRQVDNQSPGIDSIFHSSLPHIFIVEEVSATNSGVYGTVYDVFQFPDNIISQWENEGYVYFIKVTYANGRSRLLGGASAIQDGSMYRDRTIPQYFRGELNYFQHSSVDTYQQVMWLGQGSSNLDQLAASRSSSSYQYGTRALMYQTDPIPICINAFQSLGTDNFQINYGSMQKKYIAVGRSRYWPRYSYDIPTSNHMTYLRNESGQKAAMLSPFSYSTAPMVSRSSNDRIVQVSQVRVNLKYAGGVLTAVPINSSGGEIKISNSSFTIGGLDLRNTPYSMITQYTGSNPQYFTNYQGIQQYNWDPQESRLNYGFNSYKFPQNSSWQLDQRTPTISANGVDLWSPNNIPLRLMEQYTVNVPKANRQVSDSPTLLTTINTGGSQGHMQVVYRYLSSTKDTFYPGQFFQITSSTADIRYINPGDTGGIQVPQNFSLLNLPVNQLVPIHYVCGTMQAGTENYSYTLWLHNNGNGSIGVYSTVWFPTYVPRDGRTVPSPQVSLQLARLL